MSDDLVTQVERLRVALENFKTAFITALVPAFTFLTEWATKKDKGQ